MTNNMNIDLFRPLGSLLLSGGVWVADMVTPTPDSYWMALLKEVGLPTAMLILAVYGLHNLNKKLQESQAARVQDAKDMLEQYRSDAEKAEKSRGELIREVRMQTNVIKENKQ